MQLFVVDSRSATCAGSRGLISVVGPGNPTAAEKAECVRVVERFAKSGWAIAADPHTLIGRVAARMAVAAGARFVALGRVPGCGSPEEMRPAASRLTRDVS